MESNQIQFNLIGFHLTSGNKIQSNFIKLNPIFEKMKSIPF